MAKRLLSGGEALAHAALASGVSVIAGYPTDAVSQLVEAAIRQVIRKNATGVYAQWTANDKTTLGICAAASISGFRSLATFSQTGFSETVQGIAALNRSDFQGGLVVVVADEPSSDAYTANLDVRRISELAKIPVLDPATPEDAFNCMPAAFILSERYNMPVVIHISADINNMSSFFDIQPHTKATTRKGSFFKDRESIDVTDLLPDETQDFAELSDNDISDIDVRLKEIAHTFTYKDVFSIYNKIYEFEQQYEGKHNSKRFGGASRGAIGDGYTAHLDVDDNVPNSLSSKVHNVPVPNGSTIDPNDEFNIKIGICVCGSAAPYAIEAIETLRAEAHKSKVSTPYIRMLALSTPFPVPKRTLRKFLDGLNDILVIEEFSSFAEEELIKQCAASFLGPSVHGRFTDEVNYNYPINFETTIMHIAAFIDKCLNIRPEKGIEEPNSAPTLDPITNIGKHSSPTASSKNLTPKQSRTLTGLARRLANPESIYTYNYEIPDRPPVLCAGCPHRASFYAIENALTRLKIPRRNVIVSGDAGCSLLGNNPPLNFLDAYLGEGFSTSLAQGFSLGIPTSSTDAKSVAILGDSSFFADAIPSITNAIVNDLDVTLIILDNKTCAESGLQPTPTSHAIIDIAEVLYSLGIQNVRESDPFEFANAIDSCIKAIRDPRPSAVVLSSKCARLVRTGKASYINTNKCTGCQECITKLGCPAISFNKDIIGKKSGTFGQAVIDINQCNGCRLCIHVCPSEAIRIMMYKDVAQLVKQARRKAKYDLDDDLMPDMENEDVTLENSDPDAQTDEETLELFSSGPLVVIEDEPENEPDDEDAKKAQPKKVSKKYVQAEFGTLFGGRNAEFRLDFEDDDEVLEETFEAELEDFDESDVVEGEKTAEGETDSDKEAVDVEDDSDDVAEEAKEDDMADATDTISAAEEVENETDDDDIDDVNSETDSDDDDTEVDEDEDDDKSTDETNNLAKGNSDAK